jgi:formylglycine-generating enzyme required for sulfatase activity
MKMNWKIIVSLCLAGLIAAVSCADESEFELTEKLYRDVDASAMVRVPAGEFTMGSDEVPGLDLFGPGSDEGFADERPEHLVLVSKFRIDLTEVSNAQYRACVAGGACTDPWSNESHSRKSYYLDEDFNDYPVLHVSHLQAEQYCVWRGLRLPTEAEWEKAARGPYEWTFPWGFEQPDCEMAAFSKETTERDAEGEIVFTESCSGDTLPVEQFQNYRSPYGLFNLAGNVAEWVADRFHGEYYDVEQFPENSQDPTGPEKGDRRVIRGGSFADNAYFIRTAYRGNAAPGSQFDWVGFRCAVSE